MLTSIQPYRDSSEGQIALERALFCLDCELIFAGSTRCPRCADEAVWPLTQWLPPARSSAAMLLTRAAAPPVRALRIVYLDEDVSNR
jgi:hypothetical protein